MTINDVLDYFKEKAEKYDDVDKQVYWNLSDKLLWHLLEANVLSKLPENLNFLDAGGGTGRWSMAILNSYEKSTGVLYDLSPDMLKQAEIKRKNGLEERLTLIKGTIEDLKLDDEIFDLSFTFHNVLGFVNNPEKAISEMQRTTKKGGYIISMIPSLYHNIFFNISMGHIDAAEEYIKSNKGKFTQNMPYMHLFTPETISKIYLDLGINDFKVLGFPVTIYPGYQETQLSGTSERIKNILEDNASFEKIYAIEKNLCSRDDSAARGNNLLIIGKK